MTPKFIWRKLGPFQSVTYTQTFLFHCYEAEGQTDSLAKSYKNSYPMSYYLNHGEKYYMQAEHAPNEIKPVLLFYGMIQLLKACLLTIHPDYPENSDVLAHGVSSRKRKKQDYSFFDDTVTVQKKGLFSVLTKHLYDMNPIEGTKFTMRSLLLRIPELSDLFNRIHHQRVNYPIDIKGNSFLVSNEILDDLHMTERRFEAFLNAHELNCTIQNQSSNMLDIYLYKKTDIFSISPFLYDIQNHPYLPCQKVLYHPLPELLVHYLLLYNLSMISRYETEWWNDLFHQKSSNDLPYITEFLYITEVKIPYYVMTYLSQKEGLFHVHN